MYSLDDLTRPMTRQECQEAIYSALAAAGTNTTAWKPGAVVRTMIVAVSAVMAAFTTLTAAIAKSGFLELAAGDWLAIVAHYVYGVDKQTATFAKGTVVLTNEAGGVFPIGPNDLIVSSPTTGKAYRNLEAFTLGALETKSIAVVAVEVGKDSDAAAFTITAFGTPLLNVLVTNPSPLEARNDDSDGELRARCYERLGALSPNGPWDAYSYVCKSALREDGSPIGVTRVRLLKDGYGGLRIYVATATGGIASGDVAILQREVDQKATTQCVNALVISATPRFIDITHETWIYNTSALTSVQLEDAVYKRLRAYVQAQPLGGNILTPTVPPTGRIYADAIRTTIGAAIGTALPGLIVHTDLSLPAGDLILAVNEVPVIGNVLSNLHSVPTPEGHSP